MRRWCWALGMGLWCLALGLSAAETPVGIDQMLPKELVGGGGQKVARSVLTGKLVGILFAAGSSSPSRGFAPMLVGLRDQFAAEFEVVLVGQDRTEPEMLEFMRKFGMKWSAVPYAAREREALVKRFGVEELPCLIVLDAKGRVVDREGCASVANLKPEEAIAKWKKPRPVDVFFGE